ncbi:MAG: DUF4340 domain-containing protein [Gammaproteobacteria bacterium]|nr:DUF4340 domain-containing protein [Gammaproteobacteria bacterium]
MKKSYFTNLALLLIIFSLYWFINQESEVITAGKLISSLTVEKANTIRIQRHNREDIIINKEGEHWLIKQPLQAPANDVRINLILNVLTTRSHSQFEPSPNQSLQQFDLEPAKVRLYINDHSFDFGNVEPLSKHRYIHHNATLHLADDTIAPLLNANAASFINNRLLNNENNISKLTLPSVVYQDSHSKAITISLKEGHWTSSNTKLSTDALTTFIENWQNAYAMQVQPISTNKIQRSIGQTISIEFDDQSTINLLLQFDNHSMSVINPNAQLQYQFPLPSTQQFFPMQETVE